MHTIGRMLLEQGDRLGDRVALHDAHSSLSYQALSASAQRVAAFLVDHDVAPGHCLLCVGRPASALVLEA
jgi:non-ribosomal peptide synthetase component E (peptide arylation enzyme)